MVAFDRFERVYQQLDVWRYRHFVEDPQIDDGRLIAVDAFVEQSLDAVP